MRGNKFVSVGSHPYKENSDVGVFYLEIFAHFLSLLFKFLHEHHGVSRVHLPESFSCLAVFIGRDCTLRVHALTSSCIYYLCPVGPSPFD